MFELPRIIPDITTLLALEPEELGGKLLLLIRRRIEGDPSFLAHCGNLQGEPFGNRGNGGPVYPDTDREAFFLAFAEAWSWLEVQGLLVPANGGNGSSGFRVLSRRARRMESEMHFANFRITRMLPREILHPMIADRVWSAFIRGEFDNAAFQAMKAVEVSVRDASGLSGELGVRLMRRAFDPKSGPLTDSSVDEGEREARSALFAGAIGSYKNPHSHRDVNLDSPDEAVEIILLANHLLRIVDARAVSANDEK